MMPLNAAFLFRENANAQFVGINVFRQVCQFHRQILSRSHTDSRARRVGHCPCRVSTVPCVATFSSYENEQGETIRNSRAWNIMDQTTLKKGRV
jgi:hypothetical protein